MPPAPPATNHGREVGSTQGVAHGAVDHLVDERGITESHLGLGGVDVDIDRAGVHDELQHRRGMLARLDEAAVGLLERVLDGLVADGATVDEHMLPARRGARDGGESDEAPQRHAAGVVERVGGAGEVLALHLRTQQREGALAGRLAGREVDGLPPVDLQRETDLGVRHREIAHDLRRVALFGGGGLQELPSCGGVEEEIPHTDARAHAAGLGAHL